jgi:hypothetical protein
MIQWVCTCMDLMLKVSVLAIAGFFVILWCDTCKFKTIPSIHRPLYLALCSQTFGLQCHQWVCTYMDLMVKVSVLAIAGLFVILWCDTHEFKSIPRVHRPLYLALCSQTFGLECHWPLFLGTWCAWEYWPKLSHWPKPHTCAQKTGLYLKYFTILKRPNE